MTALVLEDCFVLEHNRLEAAEQEYRLASRAFKETLTAYDGRDPSRVAALDAAAERRSRAWDAWWALRREG